MQETNSTKEKIIDAAIELFAGQGYHKTSVRNIAGLVGIHPSSLYSHFTGKDEILDTILDYYKRTLDEIKISDIELESLIDDLSPREILLGGMRKIKKSVSSERMKRIIPILLNEMYRNPKIREFYFAWFFGENRDVIKKLFHMLSESGKIRPADPDALAGLYDALVNSHYQEFFLCRADGRDTTELEYQFQKRLECFLNLIE